MSNMSDFDLEPVTCDQPGHGHIPGAVCGGRGPPGGSPSRRGDIQNLEGEAPAEPEWGAAGFENAAHTEVRPPDIDLWNLEGDASAEPHEA